MVDPEKVCGVPNRVHDACSHIIERGGEFWQDNRWG